MIKGGIAVKCRGGALTITLLFIVLALSSMVTADGENVAVKEGMLIIDTHTSHFASIAYYPGLKTREYKEALFETKIRGDGGTSWAPGLYLYWRSSKSWISLRLINQYYVIEGNMVGKWFRYRDSSIKHVGSWGTPGTDGDWLIPNGDTWSRREWSRLRVLLTPRDISFFVAYSDGQWQHLCTLERTITDEEPYLILGKGYGASNYTNPYLTNSGSTATSLGSIYLDDVMVKMDDEIILQDTFDGELGGYWILLLEGDSDIEAKISLLDLLPTKGSHLLKPFFILESL